MEGCGGGIAGICRKNILTKIVGEVRPTISMLEPGHTWLVKGATGGFQEWLEPISNASLGTGKLPTSLKEAIIKDLFWRN